HPHEQVPPLGFRFRDFDVDQAFRIVDREVLVESDGFHRVSPTGAPWPPQCPSPLMKSWPSWAARANSSAIGTGPCFRRPAMIQKYSSSPGGMITSTWPPSGPET